MKIKFSRFEKMAGIFVLSTVVGILLVLFSVALEQGWFDGKQFYRAQFENGEGIRPGTQVQISGLRVGKVTDVRLLADGSVQLSFYVFSKYVDRLREDSFAQMIRPFVIGEKVMDIRLGTESLPVLSPHSQIPSKESVDLMSLFGGKNLNEALADMGGMMKSIKKLAEAFLTENRTDKFIEMFDRVDPLLKNMNRMSIDVAKLASQGHQDNRFGDVLAELTKTTRELNALIPEIKNQSPHLARDLSALVSNLAELTGQFKLLSPAFAEIAPELPRASRRAVEALDEAVVLMKALQKSFLVRSHVKDVREKEAENEAAARREQPARQPAGEKSQDETQ
ncbi:MAG: MlaD family protein [Bdellovibrio sp.]